MHAGLSLGKCAADGDLSAEARALKAIFAQERQLRDRNSQLMVPGRTFKRVLDILAKVQAAQAASVSRPSATKPSASSRPHHSHVNRLSVSLTMRHFAACSSPAAFVLMA